MTATWRAPPARCCAGRYCVTAPTPTRSGSCAGTRPNCATGSIRTPAGACTSTPRSRGCSRSAEPDADGTHPAREPRSQLPFGRRRYVLVCLALSVLERADAQITLGRLAEGIIVAAGDERLAVAGVTFELSGREERSDLVAVVRVLLELGVLARVAGDEDAFVREAGDVLYDVQRHVMAVLISAPRGPSTIAAHDFDGRLRELIAEPEPVSEDLRTRAIRHRLTRRLLDEPVVYFDELSEAELAYLTSQRSALTKRISERTGLVAEIRAEGIAMVDPRDELTDVRMPEVGTDGHVALLITEYLAARADDDGPAAHQRAARAGAPAGERASGVLAAEHPRPGRRGRTRGACARAARGTAPHPPCQ